MTDMNSLSPSVREAFKKAYYDLVFRDCDRTDADLALLEKEGLMTSRVLADDDDFFGIDSLEPGDVCFEFTRSGQALCDLVERKHAAEIPTWGDDDE